MPLSWNICPLVFTAALVLITCSAVLLPKTNEPDLLQAPTNRSARHGLHQALLHPTLSNTNQPPASALNLDWDLQHPTHKIRHAANGRDSQPSLAKTVNEFHKKNSLKELSSEPEKGSETLALSKPWKPWKPHGFANLHATDCPGNPLILTPYIDDGQIETAQELAKVILPGTDVLSYSGYFTVNQSDNSNTFFWFFPAEVAEPEKAPVVVWLQGGPGATSMFGLFDEHGPFSVTDDLQLKKRDYRWTLLANVIYIDNPVGTGFSFTQSDDGYARNEDQVGENLYQAMLQFYKLFPQYQTGQLYITGESYAGKYVPALGHTIHVKNPTAKLKIPLTGVAIGNGFVDPENMLDYGSLLYQVGLADSNERAVIDSQMDLVRKAIQEKRWIDAFTLDDEMMDGDIYKYPTYFFNITGSRYYYNYLQSAEPAGFGNYLAYLNQCYVRGAIHVGNQVFDGGVNVEKYLLEDVFQTAKDYLVPLLENYRVLIYNGQLDLICGLPLTENYLSKLNWNGADGYRNSQKIVWKVESQDVEPAGYVRQSGQFYQVALRGGGHMIPFDQPRFAFDLFYRFLNNGTFRN